MWNPFEAGLGMDASSHTGRMFATGAARRRRRSAPGGSEAELAARVGPLVEAIHDAHVRGDEGHEHELGDAVAGARGVRRVTGVEQRDAQLAAVAGIDE